MENQRKHRFLVASIGVFLIVAGAISNMCFKLGYCQEMVLNHSLIAVVIALLSIVAIFFGIFLILNLPKNS